MSAHQWAFRPNFISVRRSLTSRLRSITPSSIPTTTLQFLTAFRASKMGYVTLLDTPGLGLTISEDEIAAHPPLPRAMARGGTVKGI